MTSKQRIIDIKSEKCVCACNEAKASKKMKTLIIFHMKNSILIQEQQTKTNNIGEKNTKTSPINIEHDEK